MIVSNEAVARFVSAQLGYALCPPYVALGTEVNGRIVNGVIFSCFEGADVQVTIAGTGWTRRFIEAVGSYVFDQLGCERMTATTEFPEIAEYGQRLGGKVEGLMRNHFGKGRDAWIVGILRDEWRYARFPVS